MNAYGQVSSEDNFMGDEEWKAKFRCRHGDGDTQLIESL